MQFTTFRPSHLFAAIAAVILGIAVLSWAPWSAQARGGSVGAVQSSNVAMNCAPGQQAQVHQAVVGGELKVMIDCSNQPLGTAMAYRSDFDPSLQGPFIPVSATPAVYRPASVPVQTYAPRATTRSVARRAEPRRDWKRETLIIGGSAGAGAGIGGLIGGKKGALIGAALGGGSAALYRAAKN